MARLTDINAEELPEKDRDLLKLPLNLYRQLVNSPDGARAFRSLGHHIRFGSSLDPRLRGAGATVTDFEAALSNAAASAELSWTQIV